MSKRWVCYVVWLFLAACLYFFENNTGTRIVALCSILLPLIPGIRGALFSCDKTKKHIQPTEQNVKAFSFQEEEEPGGVRDYSPGDPVNRIHWKLSAKRERLLVREQAGGQTMEEAKKKAPDSQAIAASSHKLNHMILAAGGFILLSLLLLFLIPSANQGAQALLNRIFQASEAVNAYAYQYFPVEANQSIVLAALLLIVILCAFVSIAVVSGSHLLALCLMAGCVAFQVYFGLPFPSWVNGLLFALFFLWMVKRPWTWKNVLPLLAGIAAVSLAVLLLWPGVDAATEAASEKARDMLSQLTRQISDAILEQQPGETETRHTHNLTLTEGKQEARTEKEYRLVTVAEEQISMPHWVNYLKIALLLLLTAAVVILPFLPFQLLNVRRKKGLEARKAFQSENVSEAICAIFQHVVGWLKVMGMDAGNLPYREWKEYISRQMEKDYADQFSECAKLFEEAAYSDHPMQEDQRRQALDLLNETERKFQAKADWKQRLRLRYKECLWV